MSEKRDGKLIDKDDQIFYELACQRMRDMIDACPQPYEQLDELMKHIENCETCLVAIFEAFDKFAGEDGLDQDGSA
jgi:hypothetical protein